MALWQEIAENFFVERADFTASRNIGNDFASNLTSSYPMLVRRDLGDAFGSMLRPVQKDWFSLHTSKEEEEEEGDRQWLERAARIQRRAMYDRMSGFTRAMKEADHDYAAFGQCVISIELNMAVPSLLYRTWHLRDVAWSEDNTGKVSHIHRKWKPDALTLIKLFPSTVSDDVREVAKKNPFETFDCRHIIIPSSDYQDGMRWQQPWVSVYVDVTHSTLLEEVGLWNQMYVVPRWQTVSGSQYAYSAATVAALPEARLVQAMTLTLLEAGQVGVRPPLVAQRGALKSDIEYFAGGITYVDSEYDESTGVALRTLELSGKNTPLGMEMLKDSRSIIETCFFINRINMPPAGGAPEMTAFEVGQRVQQYIRQALPLFEPMELESNGAVCDITFDLLLRANTFGPPDQIPPLLRGSQVQFKFTSPLHEAIESQKGQKMMEANALLAQAVQLDPSCSAIINAKEELRDVLRGIAVPANWMRTEDQVAMIEAKLAQQQQAAQLLATMQQGATVAKTAGEATQAFASSGGRGMGAGAAGVTPGT